MKYINVLCQLQQTALFALISVMHLSVEDFLRSIGKFFQK